MGKRDSIKERFSKERVLFLPYFSILVILLITIGATYLFYRNSISRDYIRFENEATKINARLENELNNQLTALNVSRHIIESDQKPIQNDELSFVETKNVGFLEYDSQEKFNSDNSNNLDISKFNTKGIKADIFDLGEIDRDLLIKGISTDKLIISEVNFNTGDDANKSGYVLLLPVFDASSQLGDSNKQFKGFVYNYLYKKDALDSIYKDSSIEVVGLELSLDDQKIIKPESNESKLNIGRTFSASGSEWKANYFALQKFFDESNAHLTSLIPVIGILLGVMVFVFLRFEALTKIELAEIAEELEIAQSQKAKLLTSEQEARQEAESSNRMKDEFISMISHEIRTPLNSIAGWANILKTENLAANTKQKALQTIKKNIKTQSEMIDELLLFSTLNSKEQALKIDPVKISKILEEAVEEVLPSANSKGVHLLKENRLNGERLECDEKKLKQAIMHLLNNAIKFTPSGGEIKLTANKSNEHINLKIKDSGKGIEKEFLPHIFDKFRQADSSTTREFGGLGLGLAISQQIIELHGGKIKVSSEGKDKGTEFDIILPRDKN